MEGQPVEEVRIGPKLTSPPSPRQVQVRAPPRTERAVQRPLGTRDTAPRIPDGGELRHVLRLGLECRQRRFVAWLRADAHVDVSGALVLRLRLEGCPRKECTASPHPRIRCHDLPSPFGSSSLFCLESHGWPPRPLRSSPHLWSLASLDASLDDLQHAPMAPHRWYSLC